MRTRKFAFEINWPLGSSTDNIFVTARIKRSNIGDLVSSLTVPYLVLFFIVFQFDMQKQYEFR